VACEFGGCTQSAEFAVHVTVRDSGSDSLLVAGVRGVVRDGFYVDSLRPHYSFPDVFAAGYERGGRYTVRVEMPGYVLWEMRDVVAEESACFVQTAELVARLERQG
jgi:hypothetical protein